MSVSAYTPLTTAENLFFQAVWSPLLSTEMAALYVSVPWLSVWPIKPILDYAVNALSTKLFSGLSLVLDMGAVAFVNQQHKDAFDAASAKLAVIAQESGPDSQEFKDANTQELATLSQFVHIGPS